MTEAAPEAGLMSSVVVHSPVARTGPSIMVASARGLSILVELLVRAKANALVGAMSRFGSPENPPPQEALLMAVPMLSWPLGDRASLNMVGFGSSLVLRGARFISIGESPQSLILPKSFPMEQAAQRPSLSIIRPISAPECSTLTLPLTPDIEPISFRFLSVVRPLLSPFFPPLLPTTIEVETPQIGAARWRRSYVLVR